MSLCVTMSVLSVKTKGGNVELETKGPHLNAKDFKPLHKIHSLQYLKNTVGYFIFALSSGPLPVLLHASLTTKIATLRSFVRQMESKILQLPAFNATLYIIN